MKKYYFIGIAGIGMSGLAKILLEKGNTVSGSDPVQNKQTIELEGKGAIIYQRQEAKNITSDIDLVIVTSAVKSDNPEIVEAKRLGIKIIGRSELLNEIITAKQSIAVTGTHGKTTTSGMIASILEHANLDPTAIIGAEVHTISGNAKSGKGTYAVAEVCEYQRAFLDIFPHIAIITNIEEDHLDCYKDLDDIINTFADFITHIDKDGFLIVCGEDKNIDRSIAKYSGELVRYGLTHSNDVYAKNIHFTDHSTRFDLVYFGKEYSDFVLQIPGTHNILNALAAITLAFKLEVSEDTVKETLSTFRGAGRRFQILGEVDDVLYIDDYAHHPTEIQATLKGAKEFYPDKRIIAVFQPHQHSRTKFLMEDFSKSFNNANLVIMPEIYAVRDTAEDIENVSSKQVVEKINKTNKGKALFLKNFEDVVEYLGKNTKKGDVVITIGAGPINKVGLAIVNNEILSKS